MAWSVQRKARYGDESIGTASGLAVIPVGGGTVNVTVTAAQLGFSNKIEGGISVSFNSTSPTVSNIYYPVFGLIGASTAIGMTLGGGTGTTLGWTAAAYGW